MQRTIKQELRVILVGPKVVIEQIEIENPTADEAARGNKPRVAQLGKMTVRQNVAWELADKLVAAKAKAEKEKIATAPSTNQIVDPTKSHKFKDSEVIESASPRIGTVVDLPKDEPKVEPEVESPIPAEPADVTKPPLPAEPDAPEPVDPTVPVPPAPKKRGRPRKNG